MFREYPKSVKRELGRLNSIAYEREMDREMEKLESSFRQWRAGEINAFALSERIHAFHQGPSRKLFSIYEGSGSADANVVAALRTGLLKKEEVPAAVIESLQFLLEAVAGFEAMKQEKKTNE